MALSIRLRRSRTRIYNEYWTSLLSFCLMLVTVVMYLILENFDMQYLASGRAAIAIVTLIASNFSVWSFIFMPLFSLFFRYNAALRAFKDGKKNNICVWSLNATMYVCMCSHPQQKDCRRRQRARIKPLRPKELVQPARHQGRWLDLVVQGAATSTNTDHIGSNEAQLTIGGTRVDVLELKDHSHNNHMTTMSLTADTPAVAWLTSAHSGDGKAEEETIAATPEVSQDYSTPSN